MDQPNQKIISFYLYLPVIINTSFLSQVMDKNILPYYPYRDDGVPLFNAIKRYVTKVVNHYYGENLSCVTAVLQIKHQTGPDDKRWLQKQLACLRR